MKLLTYSPLIEAARYRIMWRMNREVDINRSPILMAELIPKFLLKKDGKAIICFSLLLSYLWLSWKCFLYHGEAFPPYNNKLALPSLRKASNLFSKRTNQ